MKSLTEIIAWLSDLQPDDDQMIKLHENELSDTIHYLTEYREMLENVVNEPLEYEELQQTTPYGNGKVFDWDKAAKIIKERKPETASAGLAEDWFSRIMS